jgi:hypothetical protein
LRKARFNTFAEAHRFALRDRSAGAQSEGDPMPHALSSQTEPVAPLASWLSSDDECVRKLAMLLEHRDTKDLDEVVALIGRLAVTLE